MNIIEMRLETIGNELLNRMAKIYDAILTENVDVCLFNKSTKTLYVEDEVKIYDYRFDIYYEKDFAIADIYLEQKIIARVVYTKGNGATIAMSSKYKFLERIIPNTKTLFRGMMVVVKATLYDINDIDMIVDKLEMMFSNDIDKKIFSSSASVCDALFSISLYTDMENKNHIIIGGLDREKTMYNKNEIKVDVLNKNCLVCEDLNIYGNMRNMLRCIIYKSLIDLKF